MSAPDFNLMDELDMYTHGTGSNQNDLNSIDESSLPIDDSLDSQSMQDQQRRSQRRRSLVTKADRALTGSLGFMNDFDPSKRTEQKKRKRYVIDKLGRLQIIAHNYDNCDCLIKECRGCHYPCKKCGDRRCGHDCRQNRRWIYEALEVEGRKPKIERINEHCTREKV